MSFLGELRRRNVIRVAVAYLVASWLIVQIVGVLTDPLNLPDVLDTVVVVLLAIGFPFALIVAWVYDVTPEGIKVTSEEDGARQPASISGQRLSYVVAGMLVIAVVLVAVDNYVFRPSSSDFGAGSRLAVLPCDDLSPDPNDSFFALGMHEELLNRLASVSALDVVSRTSVMRYEGRGRPPLREIAAQLNADAIIECSARYAGDRVLLTAQLIDAATDTHLWSDTFPGDMRDPESIFEIQADIAIGVADALKVEFFGGEREEIERVRTESSEAYQFYLAAQAFPRWDASDRRLELIEEALGIDASFVDALIVKSEMHTFRGEHDLSSEAANRALELAPGNARVHVALGYSMMFQGRWIEAEQYYRRSLELGLKPSSIAQYGFLHMVVGRFDEARPALEAYLDLNPLDDVTASFLMMLYELLGDEDARREAFERGERLYPIWPERMDDALIRLAEGDHERLRDLATVVTGSGISVHLPGVSNLDAPANGIVALRELRAELELDGTLRSAAPVFLLSAWAAFFGDSELALEWLEESLTQSPTALSRAWYPIFDSVRRQPGFERVLADLGLPEYWDAFGWPNFCQRISDEEFECALE